MPLATNPIPSSATLSSMPSFFTSSCTAIVRGWAWRTALASASCATRKRQSAKSGRSTPEDVSAERYCESVMPPDVGRNDAAK